MATISDFCRECGKAVQLHVAQSIVCNELVWHTAYCCDFCGTQEVMDDSDVPPDEMRYEIIKAEGLWHLSMRTENNV